MKAAEKKQIATFLDTVDSYLAGYPCGIAAGCPVPDFQDDTVRQPEHNTAATASGITVSQIAEKISRCTRCQLSKTRTNTVPGIGCLQPLVLVIGEGPGADEDARGEPFVGRAGQLLDKMLAAIKLSRQTNCFIANIVKCRPPHNRDPLPEEAAACRSYLDAQIHVLKPKMILAVGRIAAQNLLQTTEPIGRLRGRFFDCNGIPVMPTYHPSALLRNEDLKRPAWEDLKLFKRHLDGLCGQQQEQR